MSTQNINSLKNNVYWYDIQIEISITKSAINQYWDIKPCVNMWNIRKSKANIGERKLSNNGLYYSINSMSARIYY